MTTKPRHCTPIKMANFEAIPLDDIGSLLGQPVGGLQVVKNLPSSQMHSISVESLSDRVRNLRAASESQSSLVAAAAVATVDDGNVSEVVLRGAGAAQQQPTQQQTYMTAYRGSALKASRKGRAGKIGDDPQQQQQQQQQYHESYYQPQQQPSPSCPVAFFRAITGALSRAYDLATGFGSAIDDTVAADFGTGVGAFFTIFRQCTLAAVVSAVAVFFFLVFPQLTLGAARSALDINNNVSRGQAISGADIRPQSLLYYGAYSNVTLLSSGYSLKNAYFFAGLGFLVFNLICVAKILATAVQDHYVQSSGELRGSSLLATVFSAWDFSMRSPRAVAQRRSAIATSFKEMAVQIGKQQRSRFANRASSMLQALVVNLLSLLFITVGALLLGVLFGEHIYRTAQDQLSGSNLLPSSRVFFAGVIAGYYLVLCCLRVLAMLERHTELYYNVTYPLIRNGLFTLVMVATLAFLLHALIFCHSSEPDQVEQAMESITCKLMGRPAVKDGWTVTSPDSEFCWESWMAAQLYRLNLYDLYGALVTSFLLEILPKLLSMLPIPLLKKSIRLNIDLGYNAAWLTFSMSLFWLGAFFSPPLTLLAALKILLLFFYKWLILHLCFTPTLAGMGKLLTAKTIATFLFLNALVAGLFLSFLIYSLPVSATCGPFREGRLLRDVYFDQSKLVGALRVVTSGTSQVVLLCLFLTLLVRMSSVAQGKEDAIRALKRYIVLENSECVRLNKQINARLRRHAELLARNQRRQYY